MSKIIMLSGLPGSGKSTKARELCEEYGNFYRISKDNLRTMLHFNKWTGKNEGLTKDVERAIAKYLLTEKDMNVIVDDTNLGKEKLDSWKGLAKEVNAKFEHIFIDTPVQTCVERDSHRKGKVGKSVIRNMALQQGMIEPPQGGWILSDLDGTLADCSRRRKWVEGEKKDWTMFFKGLRKDPIRYDVWKDKIKPLFKDSKTKDRLIIVTARPERYKEQTMRWLQAHHINYFSLIMRHDNDTRPDEEIKKDMLTKHFKANQIAMVFDDRPRIIRMWKEAGVPVTDCGDGVEF